MRFVNGSIDFVSDLARGLLEFLDSLSKALGQFGQLPRAEQNEDEREDQNDLAATQVKNRQKSVHSFRVYQFLPGKKA